MLVSREPSVLGNSNQGYSLPYNALCRPLLPLLEWQLASSVLVVCFAFKCLRLTVRFCLDMLETAAAEGVPGYYLCFVFPAAPG